MRSGIEPTVQASTRSNLRARPSPTASAVSSALLKLPAALSRLIHARYSPSCLRFPAPLALISQNRASEQRAVLRVQQLGTVVKGRQLARRWTPGCSAEHSSSRWT